jgi:ligand-binding SRPBCC domain-containing protein
VTFHPRYALERRQWLPVDLPRTFAFFAEPANLPRITPPWLGFRILTPPPLVMARGLVIDYRLRVLGWPAHWRSLIQEYDPPWRFRDVQLIGPYRRWDHLHRFWEEDGGTVVHDRVEYELPLGPLGALAHALLVRRQLARIFDCRRERLAAWLAGTAEAVAGGPCGPGLAGGPQRPRGEAC